MSLLALQRDVGTWLRDGSDAAAAAIGARYRPGLAVYLNNYRAQLAASLETTFALTKAWMGDAAFEEARVVHVDRVAPSGWTLDAYGRDFPMTLAALYPDYPEVAELAWTEWATSEAFVAPDRNVVDASSLGAVDWDRAVLRFSPTIRIAGVSTNVFDIWLALTEDRVPPAAQRFSEPQKLLVWRIGHSCRVRPMNAPESAALGQARSGETFAQLCDTLVASNGEEQGTALAGAILGQWIAEGLITDIADVAPPASR